MLHNEGKLNAMKEEFLRVIKCYGKDLSEQTIIDILKHKGIYKGEMDEHFKVGSPIGDSFDDIEKRLEGKPYKVILYYALEPKCEFKDRSHPEMAPNCFSLTNTDVWDDVSIIMESYYNDPVTPDELRIQILAPTGYKFKLVVTAFGVKEIILQCGEVKFLFDHTTI